MKETLKEREAQLEKENLQNPETDSLLSDEFRNDNDNDNFLNGSMFTNLCVLVGFALFAFTVNYVLKSVSPEDNNSNLWWKQGKWWKWMASTKVIDESDPIDGRYWFLWNLKFIQIKCVTENFERCNSFCVIKCYLQTKGFMILCDKGKCQGIRVIARLT